MIHYRLRCGGTPEGGAHEFEGWFADSAAYDDQKDRGLVSCPVCGSTQVEKAIMAPALARGGAPAPALAEGAPAEAALAAPPEAAFAGEGPLEDAIRLRRQIREHMRHLRRRIEAETEDVGQGFARQALEMHRGLREDRPIRGKATPEETRELLEEGAPVTPLPWLDDREEN
ncbi:DUF1178 family protein [Neomegalonema sp.]|uniref:DUF1178 family protein n=1 Tax=Neomegalonema sp. TaxID=2039713 RepID=UPI002639F923|nr:DUF1178 family protein [Neomegalonema sp.]MDD2868096.1 DUF1178 family protein [Neomegalonema sp.]